MNGPMGLERPGSEGERTGFLLRAGVRWNLNCVEICLAESDYRVCDGVRREASFMYLKSLYPGNR